MRISNQKTIFLGMAILVTCCTAIDPEEGRSLGLFRPFGGGQTVHYERFGGYGGGPFLKQPGYGGYESYTLSGGGFGKPFLGHGFGGGFGHGFGHGFGGGFGHGFYPGYGYPFYGYGPGFGPGFGYFK